MKLVIVESPAKAKTIQKYLGKDYKVRSSKGHVVDLPKSGIGVDVDKDYEPTYVVTKPAVLSELKKELKTADSLVLAVDPDREGEAIGWHLARELGVIDFAGRHKHNAKGVERIVFTEITADAVRSASENPRHLDMDLVNAQQGRRILDRLVGYKLSPLLWKKIRYGLSAGRVQSVAVRLIVDREIEREAFKPVEYWSIKAWLKKTPLKGKVEVQINKRDDVEEDEDAENAKQRPEGIEFNFVKLNKTDSEVGTEKDAKSILDKVEDGSWIVREVTSKPTKQNPYSPFSTSLLQQESSGRLNFPAWKTMQLAQKLYEAGHITYMRTDSLSIADKAIAEVRKYIKKEYGEKFLPAEPNVYRTKSKVAQEAHEAIRPTNFSVKPAKLDAAPDERRLYELIWRRAVASQMSPAQFESQKIIVDVANAEFQATGRRILFPGYLEVYADSINENILPEMKANDELYLHTLNAEQHFTQPPARYSEATLVKELEALGIGRPSTYAPIIQTIEQRKYVDKLGRYFKPTDVGRVVTQLLVEHFPDIVDTGFTAEMEDKLDEVANGKHDWVEMLDGFYKPFAKNLQKKDKEINKEDVVVLGKSDEKCPECGSKMVIKLGKFGKFISCSRFPDCKGILPYVAPDGTVEEGDTPKGISAETLAADYLSAPKTEDNRDYVLKQGRFGQFWAHPDYPTVKDAQPLTLKPEKMTELYGEAPKTDDNKEYLLKKGRFGMFWAHPDYPKIKDIIPIKKAKLGKKAFTASAKKSAAKSKKSGKTSKKKKS